jgi:chromosome segregation ATPase
VNDETIRLILDLAGSSDDTQELIDKLQSLKKAGDDVADTYQVLAKSGEGYELAEDDISRGLAKQVAETEAFLAANRKLNDVLATVTTAIVKEDHAAAAFARTQQSVNQVLDQFAAEEAMLPPALTAEEKAMDRATQAAIRRTQVQNAMRQSLEETTITTQVATVATEAAGVSQVAMTGITRGMQMQVLNAGRAFQDLAQGGFAGVLNNIEGIVGGAGPAAAGLTVLGTAAFLAAPYFKQLYDETTNFKLAIPEATDRLELFTEKIRKNQAALKDLQEQGSLNYFDLLKYKDLVFETAQLEAEAATAKEARSLKGQTKKEREASAAFRETVNENFRGSEDLLQRLVAAGYSQKRAEELVAGAIAGEANPIEAIGRAVPDFAKAYGPLSPESKAKEAEIERQKKAFARDTCCSPRSSNPSSMIALAYPSP